MLFISRVSSRTLTVPSYSKKPYILGLPCSGFLSNKRWANDYQHYVTSKKMGISFRPRRKPDISPYNLSGHFFLENIDRFRQSGKFKYKIL